MLPIIGVILVLILLLLLKPSSVEEGFSSNNRMVIDCVVARFNESVTWISTPEFSNVTNFLIYNKGSPITTQLPQNAIEIMIPNIGKCDQTFLHHIIHNYNNLADITLFVSGRADDPRKGPKIKETMRLVNKTHDTIFTGFKWIIPDHEYNFMLSVYRSANPENHVGEGNIIEIKPAKVRPFGKWFEQFWPGKK